MIYTAIITSKISSYEYKVRILELNKSSNAIGATPDSELYTARVLSSAGVWSEYKAGDQVFVSFLAYGASSPVILGLQFNQINLDKRSSGHFTDLTVDVNTTLSEDTSIGLVTKDNIKTLINCTRNINDHFTDVEERLSKIEQTLIKLQNSL